MLIARSDIVYIREAKGLEDMKGAHIMKYTIKDTNTNEVYGTVDESEVLEFVRSLFDADALEEAGFAFPESKEDLMSYEVEAFLGIDIADAGQVITNGYGRQFDIEALSHLFDAELCEDVRLSECDTDQEWFDLYCKLHEEEYGEPFVLDTQNPQF